MTVCGFICTTVWALSPIHGAVRWYCRRTANVRNLHICAPVAAEVLVKAVAPRTPAIAVRLAAEGALVCRADVARAAAFALRLLQLVLAEKQSDSATVFFSVFLCSTCRHDRARVPTEKNGPRSCRPPAPARSMRRRFNSSSGLATPSPSFASLSCCHDISSDEPSSH